MQETSDHLLRYSEAQLTVLLRTVSSDGASPRLASELALVLRHADQQTVSATLVVALAQAILASVDPPRAVNHLLRYLDNVPDLVAFWATVARYPEAFIGIVRLFASSQLLSSILWRRPQLLVWLLEGALWAPPPAPAVLATECAQLLACGESEGEVATTLRAFTQQHLLRIGARDLCDIASVEDTTADLSALADCVLQAGLEACVRWLTALYGVPMYTDADGVQQPCGFCVIGMGKLGGYELNFSSDVDLMYVYTSYEGSTSGLGHNGQVQQISNHEYFVTLARRLTTLVGGQGPEGQAFRVDLRLRPEGTQGQLALSLLSYEAYYARLGQTWERMALLKARPVAGDRRLGEEFLALIQSFVYQSHLDAEGVRQLRDMKGQIDAQLADKAQSRTNVKLGLGGIREIEFLIQLPQLLYGGRQPTLQDRHSLHALTKLREAGLMTPQIETTLRATYCYLRRLEHYLQMEQGAQTHTLPRQADQQRRLAGHFGYPAWEAFYQDYLERTEAVHTIFVETFQDGSAM
jgi:[glutamine synthetase] adenylyltransferase / [glutamine synthetase]-adenylyl-L-tyrosine phosphorylase